MAFSDSNIYRVDCLKLLTCHGFNETSGERLAADRLRAKARSQTMTTCSLRYDINAFPASRKKCLEELELEKKAAACLVFSSFVSTSETCFSISFVADFLTFSLNAKCKVEWKETAQRMVDEERRQ